MSAFVSNIVDKDGNAIDCNYRLHHYNSGAYSDVRVTENQQISIDSDDADMNNGGTAFSDGHIMIIHMWLDDASQCSVVKIVSDGSDSYTQPMQLFDCQAPSVVLHVADGIKDTKVIASNVSSDKYQWIYEGTKHYHKASWYGKQLCNVGIDLIEYDFGNGYGSNNVYTYDSIGEYSIGVRVKNNCGLTAEDSKLIKIKYQEPDVSIAHSPEVITTGSDVTIAITNTDEDSLITGQTYELDGVDTSELVYQFNKVSTHTFIARTSWNDGFEDLIFDTTHLLSMSNQPPTIDVSYVESGNNIIVTSGAIDPEGLLDYVEIKVYVDIVRIFNNVASDEAEWSLIDVSKVDLDADLTFYISGSYRITIQAFDTGGLSSSVSDVIFNVNVSGVDTGVVADTPVSTVIVRDYEYIAGEIDLIETSGEVSTLDISGEISEASVSGDIETIEFVTE